MSADFDRRVIEVEDDLKIVFLPHDGQKIVMRELLFKMMQLVFMQCGRKFGKALCLDTPILTPTGFVRIGDIKAGDELYDEQGCIQNVVFAHDVIEDAESYRVHFDDGEYIDACKDHQWFTWTKKDRKNSQRGLSFAPSVKNTLALYNTQMAGSEYNHSIPFTAPVRFSQKFLPVDPYLLGCWLGDGHSYSAAITTMDDDIIEAFEVEYKVKAQKHQNAGRATTYAINDGFYRGLKGLNLLANKHIPYNYQFSDCGDRIDMLKGLMDTDGSINPKGNSCEIIQKNKRLSDDIFVLIASLGMKPRQTIKVINGKNYHRIIFRPRMQVFTLPRKADIYKSEQKPFGGHRTIKKIERIDSKPMRCLTVTGESSLFLAGRNLVPTHNTDIVIYCLYWFAMVFDGCEVYFIADTMKHAGELIWLNRRLPDYLKKVKRRKHEPKKMFELRKKEAQKIYDKWVIKANDSSMKVFLKNGSVISVDGAENYANADGIEPQFIAYDEFKHHDRRYNEAMEPNLDVYNGSMLVIGTPPATTNNYYCEVANDAKRRDDGAFIQCPSYMNTIMYPEGEDDPKFQKIVKKYRDRGDLDILAREYYAKIVTGGGGSIFPMFEPRPTDELGEVTGYSKHVHNHDFLREDVKKHPSDWDFYCSFDPGSASCFAVLMAAIHYRTNAIIFLDEVYETSTMRTSTKQIFPRAFKKMMDIHPDIDNWTLSYDNAALWFYNEVQAEYGICMNPCVKDLKKKENKLGQIKDVMLSELFFMSERCVDTQNEITNYVKDKNGNIPKENDHNIDNMRYIFNAASYDFTKLPDPISIDPDDLVNKNALDDFIDYIKETSLDLGYNDIIEEFYE